MRVLLAFALSLIALPALAAVTISGTPLHVAAGGANSFTCTSLAVSAGQTVLVYTNARTGTGANYSSSTWNGSNEPADENTASTVITGLQFHRILYRGITGTANLVISFSAFVDDLDTFLRLCPKKLRVPA